MATQIVELIGSDPDIEFFRTPGGVDAEPYVTFTVGEQRQTWALNSKVFTRWVSRKVYQEIGKAPSSQSLSEGISVLAGKAIFDGTEHEVHVRIAEHEGAIWLDLCDEKWRAVKISAYGWEVVEKDIPVRFIRKRGMRPLPVPVRGGRIEELRSLVNLRRDEDWVLAISWLTAAFRPNFPFPVLNVTGEQGAAKSTLCEMLRALIDPAKPPLRRPPKDERDLMIAASNSHVVAYDNLSGISVSLSDSLCCLATGGGFGTRQLHTDGDEKLFDAIRPVMINGIDDSITRSDLLDRTVNLSLLHIPESERRDENELWEEFEKARPRILGAIIEAVVTAMRNLPTTRLDAKPRMADFAMWVVAAEPALPWKAGEFLRVYAGNRGEADALAVEASPIGRPVLAMLETRQEWSGTAGALLAVLEEKYTDDRTKRGKDWPPNRKAMGNAIRRIAPNLRRMGITVELPDKATGHHKDRIFKLARKERSARSASSANMPGGVGNEDSQPPVADHAMSGTDNLDDGWSADEGEEFFIPEPETPSADRADHADRRLPPFSDGNLECWRH